MVTDLLEEGRLRREGLLNATLVRDIMAAHDARQEDYTEAIVALLTFELWRERFGVKAP
jgi:hypothetical protein